MFCHQCGQQLPDGAQFCSRCGTRAVSAGAASHSSAAQPSSSPVYHSAQPSQAPTQSSSPANTDALKEFINYKKTFSPFLALGFGILILFLTFPLIEEDGSYIGFIISAGSILLGGYELYAGSNDVKTELERLRLHGELESAVADFSRAQSMAGGNVKLGQTYLFGRYSTNVFRYDALMWVYVEEHKTNGSTDNFSLKVGNAKGRIKVLTSWTPKEYNVHDVNELCNEIAKKNPSIMFGYSAEKERMYKLQTK